MLRRSPVAITLPFIGTVILAAAAIAAIGCGSDSALTTITAWVWCAP